MKAYPYASTHQMEEVGQRYLYKELKPGGLHGDVSARPTFVEDPTREPAAYRQVLAPFGIGPRCVASGRDWVLLERMAAPELWQIGEVSVWVEVARWVAALHGLLAAADPSEVPLLLYDAALYAAWRERAERAGCPVEVLAAHERAVAHLLELPPVVVHGDLYASNLLVEPGPPLSVWPVDWELVGRGPAVLDLAALTAGWAHDVRRSMVCAYFEAVASSALPSTSEKGPPTCERGPSAWEKGLSLYEEELDAARLHICVQWLGAPAGWVPPPPHAHDWMAEARELAQRL